MIQSKQTTVHDRLLSKRQVLQLVPYSAVHLYRLMAKGKFPRQVRCSDNRVAWSEHEVQAWIDAKKSERFVTEASAEAI